MTARELAEKILNQLIVEQCTGEGDFDKLVSKYESLLSEALAEAKKEVEMSPMPCGCRWVKVLGCRLPTHQSNEEARAAAFEEGYTKSTEDRHAVFFSEAKKEAFEEAAKIAENHSKIKGAHIHKGFAYCVEQVANEIRRRAEEGK